MKSNGTLKAPRNGYPQNGEHTHSNGRNGHPQNGHPHGTYPHSDGARKDSVLAPIPPVQDDTETAFQGDHHIPGSVDTPLREDAFVLDDAEKMHIVESHFEEIMLTLGLDLTDDSLRGTPRRVAKMFVNEIFRGLDPANKPEARVFENSYQYGEMLVEKNISLYTTCEHHFLPIVGKAHVAYVSTGTVIGLSKINRIVDYYARRPQVQERLTRQIAEEIKRALDTEDVAVVIDAKHFCVAARGIQDTGSSTVTSEFSGRFREDTMRKEFLHYITMNAGN